MWTSTSWPSWRSPSNGPSGHSWHMPCPRRVQNGPFGGYPNPERPYKQWISGPPSNGRTPVSGGSGLSESFGRLRFPREDGAFRRLGIWEDWRAFDLVAAGGVQDVSICVVQAQRWPMDWISLRSGSVSASSFRGEAASRDLSHLRPGPSPRIGPYSTTALALAQTSVTRWLAEEKNPVFIQRGVGHADLATTMGYPHLVDRAFPALVEEAEWGSSGHPWNKPCPKCVQNGPFGGYPNPERPHKYWISGPSSNGRTPVFGTGGGGSNPPGPIFCTAFAPTIARCSHLSTHSGQTPTLVLGLSEPAREPYSRVEGPSDASASGMPFNCFLQQEPNGEDAVTSL